MPYKKPHGGSTGNIHSLFHALDQNQRRYKVLFCSTVDSLVNKLSTFSSGPVNKGSIVPLRRTTNRKGKTAPAPPKRTSLLSSCSSFRDSTYADQDPGCVGGAGGESNPDDSSTLNGITKELQSLSASNKGADSEDQMTPDTDDSGAHSYPGQSSGGSAHSKARTYPPKEIAKPQKVVQVAALEVQNVCKAINRYGTLPKGARIGAYLESLRQSGMSEGVTGGGGSGGETPPSQRSGSPRNKQQLPGHMIRSNSSGGFQHHHGGGVPASPRTGTRHSTRGAQPPPSLADLEFPPPPPPEELVEAPFRFGVSLRKREPSTDSCSSAKSEPGANTGGRRGSRPKERPPSPPTAGTQPAVEEPPPPPPPPSPPPLSVPKMELKLVSEIKSAEKATQESTETSPVDFKANLRKVSHEASSNFKAQLKKFEPKKEIEDLKSRLRKVDSSKQEEVPPVSQLEDDGDDKRRSTGSISSLKKLWEGESSPPELGVKERRVWAPEEKPAVPVKPVVKPPSQAIYATPGVLASVLEIGQALETSFNSFKSSSPTSSASWLQLSDKVVLFHSSCLGYVDSIAPLHARFHLRELLTRMESQARQLRSAGSRNQTENAKTLSELQNTYKDVINAVQR
ncbi:hypothetical protein AAG570_004800 [Ranatra chinensis]|uniref:F-actin binding domain-containing protein n=1 Tax=Ranatra chinensis TaxID=642074 RepID=A0ABD0Y460_9HEMI